MAVITAAAGGGSWGTASTWTGGVVPTASDDVRLASTSGNVTISAGAVCRSLDATGYIRTLTHTAGVTLTIGTSTPGASNIALKLVTGMAYSPSSATCQITFASTSATQQTITLAGKNTGHQNFTGVGGSWLYVGAVTSLGTVTLTAGTLNTGGVNVTALRVIATGSTTRTLTLGASAVTLSNAGQAWDTSTVTGLTFTPGTSTLTFTGAGATMDSAALTFNNVTATGSGAFSAPASSCTFTALTRTGTAVKTDSLSLRANVTVTGTFTVNGTSAINRLLVTSSTVGTARTVTAAAVTASNVDLQDVTGAGAASWNLSAVTGGSGDCGGNTTVTFTTPATQTHTASVGGNWSDVTKWTSRVPLPQDDVTVNASTTGTLTADMPRLGRSVDLTGFAGTVAFTSVANSVFGSLTLDAGATLTGTQTLTLAGRTARTVTSAGKTLPQALTVNAPGGTYTLQDSINTAGALTVSGGTLDTNGVTVTASTLTLTGAASTLTLGASVVNLTSTAATTVLSVVSGTLNAGTSQFVVATATANSRTFAGGGKTFATLTYTVAGSTGQLVVTGANTFGTVNFSDPTNARTLVLPVSTITRVTTFNVVGTTGKLMSVVSSTSGTAATLSKTSGTVGVDYLSIKDIAATGGASWYAGSHSTSVSGNSGWFFTDPSGGAFFAFLMGG